VITQSFRKAFLRAGRLLRRSQPSEIDNDVERGADWYNGLYDDAKTYSSYHRPYYQSYYYFLWSVISDRVRRAGIRRVLEIGCGPGQLACLLLEQGVAEYVGLDFSSRAIEMAERNVPNGRFIVGDARATNVHAEYDHDLVICTEVLEHIEDDIAVVSRFLPGKRCICSVPSFSFPGHVRYFGDTKEVITRYLGLFENLDVTCFKSPNSSVQSAYLFYLFDGVRNNRV